MDRTIVSFVRALRRADVRVSPAETLDALRLAAFVGPHDRARLRDALGLALAKSREDKARFEACFDRFFAFDAFTAAKTKSHLAAAPEPAAATLAALPELLAQDGLPMRLLADDRNELALRLARAAHALGTSEMKALRDKSGMVASLLAALDQARLDEAITTLSARDAADRDVAQWLRGARARWQREVREFVEQQYRAHVDVTGRRGVVAAAIAANLATIQPAYYDDVRDVVRRIAAKLTDRHRRRRKRARRGQLDLRHTLRRNLAYDGNLVDLRWRQVKIERPKVFAVCDVSGSVARIARFTLLLLYSLHEVLPRVRTFAFSSSLGEVSTQFERLPVEAAIEETLVQWGKGTTDYARAFADLRALCLHEIDRRSTLVILGDGRNNHFDPRPDILAEFARRAGQVIWLNPEPPAQWDVGDSEMARFAPYCTRVASCNSLADLERFADRLLLAGN